ncbi:protein TolR [Maritimibacter sp. UBA3975]|jgi:biopolymer transport protein TolR|uniref:protein TolR n=1 Tax=Maritimibacter sp. UBA3975 TaxID=1946833 RepID=UPI000C0B2794|nr:protein TolR [Maritimibacter sp. UBA3975]MAM60988.1 protein TolR [Maritimibacter sp.]|tara:strand:+ start:37783 stop:38256 length:474 start_codon:yes stop_codon:yes gene_type:complete
MAGTVTQAKPRARRGRRRGRHRAMMAEINITPFVDVMLVLLIIFMVAAPLMTVGVPVQLPETAATPLPAVEEEPLTVTLTEEGTITLMTTEIARDDLIPRLRAVAAERTDNKIFLRADGRVPYERVAQVMGALNAAGFNDIGLVTDTGGPSMDEASR